MLENIKEGKETETPLLICCLFFLIIIKHPVPKKSKVAFKSLLLLRSNLSAV